MRYARKFILFILCTGFGISAAAIADERVVCESNRDKRNYCDVYRAYDADIRLSRQYSDSSCIEGISWGRDDRGVWVDNGCRAEFSVRRGYQGGSDYGRRNNDSYYDQQARIDYERERQRDLDREIDRTRELREQLERERANAARAPQAESCPPGFEPGSHRCTNPERKRGCKDMRMPSGKTCNSIGWAR